MEFQWKTCNFAANSESINVMITAEDIKRMAERGESYNVGCKIIYIILASPTAHYQPTDAKTRAISSLLEYCRGARRKTKSNDNSRVGVATLLYVTY